jgi:hypothetical protein
MAVTENSFINPATFDDRAFQTALLFNPCPSRKGSQVTSSLLTEEDLKVRAKAGTIAVGLIVSAF